MSKENTAVFIGHNECYGVTSEQIKEAIVSLIDKGVTEFLSGGQGGFDRLCGRCVYELKKEYPHISNYLVIPYKQFRSRIFAQCLCGRFLRRPPSQRK